MFLNTQWPVDPVGSFVGLVFDFFLYVAAGVVHEAWYRVRLQNDGHQYY